jgi:acetyl-CoA acetyltransferase
MTFSARIPYGAYWSTPFVRWQGVLANLNSVELAAFVAKRELDQRSIEADIFDYGVLGTTIPQHHSFYGLPWLMGMTGAGQVSGPTINQACATGTRCLLTAAQEIEAGLASTALVVTCDRTSNGPHLYYPSSAAPGGTGASEDWVMDNFNCDPLGRHAMINTAENVAAKHGISTEEQHEVVLRRGEQYQMALADDSAFLKRFMTLPFDVPKPGYKKSAGTIDGDLGVTVSTPEGLGRLRPVLPEGTVTFGGQTYPADGNTAMIVTTAEKARDISKDPRVGIEILGFGSARTALAFMPEATIPAARMALRQAGLGIENMDVIKSHNPFAVNDILFSRETGADLKSMNNYGCPLIWGHPQGPTALRAIIEMIEELVIRGGGTGLFEGCAAGDTAMAAIIRVFEEQ